MLDRRKIALFMSIILCTLYLVAHHHDNLFTYFVFAKHQSVPPPFHTERYILYTDGCKVPKFDPFDPTVKIYYRNISNDIPCTGKKYLSMDNNRVVLNEDAIIKDFKEKNFTCTYKAIYRNPKNETSRADNKFEYGEEKKLIFNEPLPDEFVKAFCSIEGNLTYEEFLASTPIKPLVEERCKKDFGKILMQNNLNIIVVGIDSVSKLNFERHFKRTAEYLRRNLSTFEFHGYMKVADNTFPNLVPMLTGHFISHYYNKSNRWRYYDDLDFIWKNFSSIGYRTLFAEDAPDMGTFNYAKSGFQHPPTDYFFRPFTIAIEDSPWQMASKKDCFQAKPEIIALFDYLRSFLTTMGDRPYFAFTWAARLTHNDLNKAGYADKPTFKLLKDINEMGLLNRSILIFLSDHGIRFGAIRKTFIGKIEERMPFLFISFPNWFLEANDQIRRNLMTNRHRLTTPFDLHETIVDIFQMTSGDHSYIRTPYGMSLFRDIPPQRNCTSAFILPHWCVCHEYKTLNASSNKAVAASMSVVAAVNKITIPHRKLCAELKLDAVLDTRIYKPEKDLLRYKELEHGEFENSIVFEENVDEFETLMITVRTVPGDAEFESTVKVINKTYDVLDISRINMYGNQGDCVDDAVMRKYCFCKIN